MKNRLLPETWLDTARMALLIFSPRAAAANTCAHCTVLNSLTRLTLSAPQTSNWQSSDVYSWYGSWRGWQMSF